MALTIKYLLYPLWDTEILEASELVLRDDFHPLAPMLTLLHILDPEFID